MQYRFNVFTRALLKPKLPFAELLCVFRTVHAGEINANSVTESVVVYLLWRIISIEPYRPLNSAY